MDSSIDTFETQKRLFSGMTAQQVFSTVKGIHTGRRAFILGNGPSLKIPDLHCLQNEITFAANRIYLAYDQTEWRPTYWCCSDKIVAETNQPTISALPHIKFAAQVTEGALSQAPWTYIVPGPQFYKRPGYMKANVDIAAGVHPGVSVVIFMLKLAFYMGIELVYLMGIDFDFRVPETKTGEKVASNEVIVSQGEVNHFHPDYRKPGEKWTMPLLQQQRNEFAQMRWRYEIAGRRIYNASRQSRLTVFEMVNFDNILRRSERGPFWTIDS